MWEGSLLFIAGASLAAPLAAQPAPKSRAPTAPAVQPIPRATFLLSMDAYFKRMDSNHDGKLTRAEVEASQATALRQIMARNQQIFRTLDSDRNGRLSAAKFGAFHGEPPAPNGAPMITRFDRNRDGTVSLVEFRATTLSNFDRIDTDQDGTVTADEMRAGGIGKKRP